MRLTTSITLASVLLAATAVRAEPPANVANTTWTLQVNSSIETLFIDTQGGPGAPGAANCRSIRGEVRGVAPVNGWYCPSTGRIHFVHRNLDSGAPMRVFTGSVSDAVAGLPLAMAGTVTILNAVFGDLGEYNFAASE